MTAVTAKRLRIHGLVQGVGYRASFEAQAQAMSLAGWVRNRIDGSVEAVVHGDTAAVEHMIAWARRGPHGARVDNVIVEDASDMAVDSVDFRILPSA